MAAERIRDTVVDAPVTVEHLTVAIVAADVPAAADSTAAAVADSTVVAAVAMRVEAVTVAVVTGKLLSIQSERDGLRLVPFSLIKKIGEA
jgi:hypothetical protein